MFARGLVTTIVAALLTQAPSRPAFEVSSVKPVDGQVLSSFRILPGGRLEGIASIHNWISYAYGDGTPLRNEQIIGLTERLGPAMFRVSAVAPDAERDTATFARAVYSMTRTLLEDRFKAVAHHETRKHSVYAMVVAKADGRLGPQLRRSTADCAERREHSTPDMPQCGFRFTETGVIAVGVEMGPIAALANTAGVRILRSGFGLPTVDRTNLKGTFDLEVNFGADAAVATPGATTPSGGASTVSAVFQDQLGLKFERRDEPLDVVVIDHVELPAPD